MYKRQHQYFVRAAKCLISYKKFDGLTQEKDGVAGTDMLELLHHIQTNLAASLLAEKRYEDVLYHTNFIQTMAKPTEKIVYRRAMAYYHLKEFQLALDTLQLVPEYRTKKEFLGLQQRIQQSWQTSNANYKTMVQRMFN